MEDQRAKLSVYFKKFDIPTDKAEEFGDDVTLGECWVYEEPEKVEFWSLVLIPMTNKLGLMTKYKNAPVALSVSLYEEVVDISEGARGFIYVTSLTNDPDQTKEYRFSYMIEPMKTIFSITEHCRSLQDTDYTGLLKELEQHIDLGRWRTSSDGPLSPRTLASRLRSQLTTFERMRENLLVTARNMQPVHLTREYSGHRGSQGSRLIRNPKTGRSGTGKRKAAASNTNRRPATSSQFVGVKTHQMITDAAVDDAAL